MKASRRNFIKNLGLTSLTAMGLPQILAAQNSIGESLQDKGEEGLSILFQGDSITDGNRTRNNDWNHIMGHGYACLIASRLWYNYPNKNLMFYNRGVSGNRVKDLDARWQQDALDLKPNVISIMIGVNDVIALVKNTDQQTADQFEEAYKKLLDRTKEALPNTHIVLCEPFTLPGRWLDDNPSIWQVEIPKRQEVVKKLAGAYNASFVALQKPFDEACKKAPASYWIWDGIHPMPAGHELIARHWIDEVRKTFTFIKK